MATRFGHVLRAASRALPFAVVLASVPGCDSTPAAPPNVLVIAVDTLRYDHVSFNGYPRPVTPFLDAMSRDARVFPTAYSQAPWTLPAFVTLFTSRYPSRHGVMWVSSRLPDEEVTLAEVLRENGYATQAFYNNPLLDPFRNVAQGFEGYEEYGVLRTDADRWVERNPVPQVRNWLDARDERPFFLFVHFMEPHATYLPTPALANVFDPGYEGPSKEGFPTQQEAKDWQDPLRPEELPSEEVRTHGIALYDAEVLEVDRSAGMILEELRGRGLLENTLVVFLSDHGEEHWDHGGFGHDHTVYEELIRVPLFLRFPRGVEAGIDRRRVQLLDVAPTVLDAAGIDVPDSFEGRSLLRDGPGGEGIAFAESPLTGGERKSYVEGDWKLIFDVFLGRRALYDLGSDPGETRDQATARPEKAGELFARLMAHARLPSGSWHLALEGSGEPDAPALLDARLTTTGRFVQCSGYDLETRRTGESRLDKWTVEEDGRALLLRMTAGVDVDGVTFHVVPPDSPVTFEITLADTAIAPERVFLGADGRHPSSSPFELSPGDVRSEAGVTPPGWADARSGVAVWTVEGGVDLAGETVELDSATVRQLRALGYVE